MKKDSWKSHQEISNLLEGVYFHYSGLRSIWKLMNWNYKVNPKIDQDDERFSWSPSALYPKDTKQRLFADFINNG